MDKQCRRFKVKREFTDGTPNKNGSSENDVTKLPPQGGIHLSGDSHRKEHKNAASTVSSGTSKIEKLRQIQSQRRTKPTISFGVQAQLVSGISKKG